jgi:hypothetical protein
MLGNTELSNLVKMLRSAVLSNVGKMLGYTELSNLVKTENAKKY